MWKLYGVCVNLMNFYLRNMLFVKFLQDILKYKSKKIKANEQKNVQIMQIVNKR